MIGKICGTGSYVPVEYMDNHELSRTVETSDEWIRELSLIHILYKEIHDDISPRVCKKQYRSGKASFEEGSYEDAIESLSTVISLDEGYDDGQALLLLMQAYEKAGKTEEYKSTYEKAKELYPDAVAELESKKESQSTENNTQDSGNTEDNNEE